MFDVTRASTFEAVQKWKNDLDNKVMLPNGAPIPVVLLANKVCLQIVFLVVNRKSTITWLLSGIYFICGPSSIICAQAEQGCKWCYKGHKKTICPTKVMWLSLLSIHKAKSYKLAKMYSNIRKDCLTWNHVAGSKSHLQPALCRLEHFREGSLLSGPV